MGDSQKVIQGFPGDVRFNLGGDLQRLDDGDEPLDFAPMGAVLPGVYELRDRDAERWYRVFYVRLESLIIVLHCFTKTTNQTEQRDIETARLRLVNLKRAIAEQKRREKHGRK